MSGRKRSGAQNRKRKKEAEIAFKKSSVLLAAFLKKAKKKLKLQTPVLQNQKMAAINHLF